MNQLLAIAKKSCEPTSSRPSRWSSSPASWWRCSSRFSGERRSFGATSPTRAALRVAAAVADPADRRADDAAMERGAEGRHPRAAADHAGQGAPPRAGQIPRRHGAGRRGAGADPRLADHRLDARRPRLGAGLRWLPRGAARRGGLPRDRPLHLGHDPKRRRRAVAHRSLLQRALSDRLGERAGLLQRARRRAVEQPGHGEPLSQHSAWRDRSARPGLLRQPDRRLSVSQRGAAGVQALEPGAGGRALGVRRSSSRPCSWWPTCCC
jgi:hypothetical protein